MRMHLLGLVLLAAVGCGGGGSGRSSAVVSPYTVGAAVSASLTLNEFTAFKELNSIADLQVPASGLLRNKAFVLEDKGFVHVLTLSNTKPALDRILPLDATSPFTGGVSAGSLTMVDDHTALATASGKETCYIFDPSTAKAATDVTKLDLTGMTATFTSPQTNSKGVAVASPMPLTFTASAILVKNRLFIASSNLDANFDYNPGTVVSFDLDPVTKALSNGALAVTSCFDPTRLTRYVAPSGETALLCVNGGAAGVTSSSIDIIDPARSAIVASIPLAKGSASGVVAITPDGKRGYVGSSSAAEVYELDLSNLGPVIASTTVQSLPARFLGAIGLPPSTGLNYIAGVGVSTSGRYVYATNFNTSALAVVDIAAHKVVGTVAGFQRGGDPTKFESNASALVVRPGVPGLDFQGPPVFVATISIDVVDRTIPNVTVALDGVSFDRN